MDRRELATRSQAWPRAIARALARAGVTPNQVSVASIVFAALAAYAFWKAGAAPLLEDVSVVVVAVVGRRLQLDMTTLWLVVAAVAIQLRLLCNLLDGLLAIEGGLKTKTGDLYNEIPDRVADILILGASGLALPPEAPSAFGLGVTAAFLAVLTAYVRLLGGSLGLPQRFLGPMAKQHRMFTLTVGALGAAIENVAIGKVGALHIALIIIVAGTALTLVRRIVVITRELNAR